MGTPLQKQLDWLDEAREADIDPGFPGAMVARCSLPRTGQGKRSHFVRANRSFTWTMTGVGIPRLPCGNLPLLLLAWECTETVRTGRRDGMEGLFGCAVSLHYRGDDKPVSLPTVIAGKAVFWPDYGRPDMDSFFPSEIRLSRPLFDSIARQPIPSELNCLHALRPSTAGLDLNLRLTYSAFSLTQPLALSWMQVYAQRASFAEKTIDKLNVQNFRTTCLPELTKTQLAWHEFNDATERGRVTLHPVPAQIFPVESRTPAAELASYASTALLRFSPGDCWASSLPKSLHRPILRLGLWLPPAARLPLDPLGRRKPAARTLTLALRAVCQHALPMPHWRGPALGSASSSRCRVWPLPPVPGERQTLTNP